MAGLEDLDLEKISIGDIRGLKNTVLRDALLDALQRRIDPMASHQNHGSHSDHNTDSSKLIELEYLGRRARKTNVE